MADLDPDPKQIAQLPLKRGKVRGTGSLATLNGTARRLGSLEEILVGPAHENDGRMNLFGALRTSLATCGYANIKEFQKAEVMVAPALKTEGKALQTAQRLGMGR